MPNTAWPSIRGKMTRVTKLDTCGVPVVGPKSTLATKGFIKVDIKPEYDDSEETYQKDANGDFDVTDPGSPPQLKYYNIEIQFTRVNPELWNLMTGQTVVVNNVGDAVGIGIGKSVEAFFGFELWSDTPGAACTGNLRPFGYTVVPWLSNGKVSDLTFEEKLATFTLMAKSRIGTPWGAGPYNVDLTGSAGSTTPGKLVTPIPATDQLRLQQVLVPPPAATPSAIALASS